MPRLPWTIATTR